MKNITTVLFLLFSLTIAAQSKWSIGFTLAPQLTSVNGDNWKQISPLHALVHYQATENVRLSGGYTVQYHNIATVVSYKKAYLLHLLSTDNFSKAFIGVGYTFPVPSTKAACFVEFGTPYEFGTQSNRQPFKAIFSTGIFVPFNLSLGKKVK